MYHSTQDLRVIRKEKKKYLEAWKQLDATHIDTTHVVESVHPTHAVESVDTTHVV